VISDDVTTLVLCVDRAGDVGRVAGVRAPVAGWEAVRSLVTEVGLSDPEDSSVNCILEALKVTRDLRDDDEEAVVAVVSGSDDSVVGADRAVASQVDDLVAEYNPDAAVVVIDSAEDERLVPIVESRVRVDSVDRVVVRQARDIESTYYLLKQFLADEELRQTVLVPIGLALVVFPVLSAVAGMAAAGAVITTVIGSFLLYKGLGVDDYLIDAATEARDAAYSGQVSVVTYAVAVGLTLIGVFAGGLALSTEVAAADGYLMPAMHFGFVAAPWLTAAAGTAALGRLLDEAIRDGRLSSAYLNLPFISVAIGLVVRGVAGWFLERGGAVAAASVPTLSLGVITVSGFPLSAFERLLAFFVAAVAVSTFGVRVAASMSGGTVEDGDGDPDAPAGEGP
jgi:putative membrane protein